jgi:pimeloyl-ACP methyl ester carboxylesterase
MSRWSFQEGTVEVNGLKIAYSDWGGDPARTALLVHGLGSQRHTWNPIAERLKAGRRLLALDLRGHGDSDWTREGYHIRYFVDDIHKFVQALGVAKFDFVGHSLGTQIGIAFAGHHGSALRRLVLSDAGPETAREGAVQVRDNRAANIAARGFRTKTQALEHIKQMHPEWLAFWHRLYVDTMYRRNWAGRLVEKSDPELMWLTGRLGLKHIPYLWNSARRIKVPTLLLWGRKSNLLSEEIVDRMRIAIPQLQVAEFDTGHYIQREDPWGFTEAIGRFLG